MGNSRNFIFLLVVLLLVILNFPSESSGAKRNMVYESSSGPDVFWTQLEFQGSKFLNTITVKIELSSEGQRSGDLSTKLGKHFGDCSETVTVSKLLTVHSTYTGVVFSESRYEEIIWFNEATTHPEKRIRLSNGDSPWVKSYCWEEKGVRRQKILPGNSGESKKPPARWTKYTESFYEFSEEVAGCATVSDPALVFYILSTLDPGRQKLPLEICVFGRKQLHQLTIGLEKTSSLKVSYKKHSPAGEVAIKDTITPHIFSISSDNLVPDNREPETFNFLGLHRDIRIYMDPEKRLPVRISGTNNSVGKLVLDLRSYSK